MLINLKVSLSVSFSFSSSASPYFPTSFQSFCLMWATFHFSPNVDTVLPPASTSFICPEALEVVRDGIDFLLLL